MEYFDGETDNSYLVKVYLFDIWIDLSFGFH